MRALYLNQQEKYKKEWYRIHGQKPPNLGFEEEKPKKYEPCTQTITETTIVDGYPAENACSPHDLFYSYWETENAGMEPIEFRAAANTLRGDTIIGWKDVPQPGHGEINDCFTPYENDIMSFGAFETFRAELKKRGQHLANEMKRVDDEFNRKPVKNWFCLKEKQFSIEHMRFNELKRRRAAREEFRDYYRAQEEFYDQEM
ncbi:hypothetical protein TRFO_16786 [Tritrichomonas foetus]|uniref:Uncharacterized protein n=1 Tax=Tritrichomonas foetus TaxID=1144522 RepID=A0A1J4KPJ6_9EUKA|nr:hypothetical protein TRFO_16786 [Tritrichomonas foetus]|eukprot:OHT13215.1 hypothetical protein TRFO_16786 [Tritrichomonas foetus]